MGDAPRGAISHPAHGPTAEARGLVIVAATRGTRRERFCVFRGNSDREKVLQASGEGGIRRRQKPGLRPQTSVTHIRSPSVIHCLSSVHQAGGCRQGSDLKRQGHGFHASGGWGAGDGRNPKGTGITKMATESQRKRACHGVREAGQSHPRGGDQGRPLREGMSSGNLNDEETEPEEGRSTHVAGGRGPGAAPARAEREAEVTLEGVRRSRSRV